MTFSVKDPVPPVDPAGAEARAAFPTKRSPNDFRDLRAGQTKVLDWVIVRGAKMASAILLLSLALTA
jgi:hypothetical protein